MAELDKILKDYEVQLAAQRQINRELEAHEIAHQELAQLTLSDRLAGHLGQDITVQGSGPDIWRGRLENLGLGWIQMRLDYGDLLLPLTSLTWWEAQSLAARTEQGISRRLSLAHALRAIAASRRPVYIQHKTHTLITSEGRILGVGSDYCELLNYQSMSSHRLASPRQRVIPLGSIDFLRVS